MKSKAAVLEVRQIVLGHLLRSISATQELDPVGLVHLIVDETALFNWLTWRDAVPNGLKLNLVQGRPDSH